MSEPEKRGSSPFNMGSMIAIGLAIGVALGLALDNLMMGIGLGLAFGAIVTFIVQASASRTHRDPPDSKRQGGRKG